MPGLTKQPTLRVRLLKSQQPGDGDRVWNKIDPNTVTSLGPYNSGPDAVIPPLSEAQLHALKILEETATRLALHMILEPGDIQLLANGHVLHARTAYKDCRRGALMRMGGSGSGGI